MNPVDRNPEKMQQQTSVSISEGHRMGPPPNRQPIVMIPTPSYTSTGNKVQPKTSEAIVANTGSLHLTGSVTSNPPPTVSSSLVLTSRAHHNIPMVSCPFGAQTIPLSTPTLPQPQMDRNLSLTRSNHYADQSLVSTNSSWRPHANPQGTFPTGQHTAMPLASVCRPPIYPVNTSNNNNNASICPPIVRPPSQQLLEKGSNVLEVPSVYVEQLQRYLCHWSRRPKDNNIIYWRQFVNEYYEPEGKRKCCLSACNDNSTTKYRQWKNKSPCGHCRTYSQNGSDISFEELPIYFQYKFNSLNDETLKLGAFQEHQLENKNTVLYFPSVIEQATDDQFMAIRKGPLAITFTTNKKILSWEFCMRSCEKLVSQTALISQVNEMLQTAGDSSDSGSSGSKSSQHFTQENCNRIIKIGCELTKKLEQNQFHELGNSTQDVQTNMINDPQNTVKNSTDINFRNQHKTEYSQNCTAQPTSGHQVQSQAIPSITYPSHGANNKQVNPQVPQFVNPPSVLDTGASRWGLVTGTTSSSVNPNIMTNPLCVAPPINARSLPGLLDQTNNLLKRAGTIENGLGMDALEQPVTRQRLGDAFSGNVAAIGSGSQNLSTSDHTQGLVADRNMGSRANLTHESGVNPTDQQMDQFFEDIDFDNFLADISSLEELLKQ